MKKQYFSKSIAILLGPFVLITSNILRKNSTVEIPQIDQPKRDICDFYNEELNQITNYQIGSLIYDIPYEKCRYYKETETEILLIQTLPFKYNVKIDDTLKKIIKTFYLYDTKKQYEQLRNNLLEYNHLPIDETYEVTVGDEIYIPLSKIYNIDKEDAYLILSGDTVYSISNKYNVDQKLLETINGISSETHLIYAGKYLVIPNLIKEPVNQENNKKIKTLIQSKVHK